jgi:hypothetical protein
MPESCHSHGVDANVDFPRQAHELGPSDFVSDFANIAAVEARFEFVHAA